MDKEEKRRYNTEYSRKRRAQLRGSTKHEQLKARSRERYHERKQERDELDKMRKYSRDRYASDRRLSLFEGAKRRAKLEGLPFTITIDDIVIPDMCPVLGIPIVLGQPANSPNLPSLDKFDPALGYVPGNITVMSLRANSLKRDATTEEIRLVYQWMEQFT